ncbi:hypothetical protein EON79_09295 [bacterium]|nr:MAG: hypothetical protein EON79_09295 [bacterium]
MRYRSDDIHPVLWKAVDQLTGRMMTGEVSGTAVAAHQTEWFKEYGGETLRQLIAPIILLLAGFGMAAAKLPKVSCAIVILLAIVWIVASIVMKTVGNLREMTPRELELLMPELKFEGVGRAYAEAVLAVGQSSLSETTQRETLQELKRVMDEHERIEAVRSKLEQTSSTRIALLLEVDTLQRKVEEARDPEAKAIYEESLGVAQSRLAAKESQSALGERMEAQGELLRQSVLRVRDTLALPVSTSASDSGPLREALASVRSRADEVDRAVQEVESW